MTDFSTWDRATLEQFAREARDKLVAMAQAEPVAWMLRRELLVKYNGYKRFAAVRSEGLWDVAVYTSAPTIPEGYVLVPVEPSDKMIQAGLRLMNWDASVSEIWETMLNHAPKPKEKAE